MTQQRGRPEFLPLLLDYWPFSIGSIVVLVSMLPAGCFFLLGRDLFHYPTVLTPGTPDYGAARYTSVFLSLIFFIGGGSSALFGYLKCSYLSKHGMIIVGTVRSIPRFRLHGSGDVSYTYCVDGKGYEGRVTVTGVEADGFRTDPQIFLLVSPRNPAWHMRLTGYKIKKFENT